MKCLCVNLYAIGFRFLDRVGLNANANVQNYRESEALACQLDAETRLSIVLVFTPSKVCHKLKYSSRYRGRNALRVGAGPPRAVSHCLLSFTALTQRHFGTFFCFKFSIRIEAVRLGNSAVNRISWAFRLSKRTGRAEKHRCMPFCAIRVS